MTPTAERFDLVLIGSGSAREKGAAQAAYFVQTETGIDDAHGDLYDSGNFRRR